MLVIGAVWAMAGLGAGRVAGAPAVRARAGENQVLKSKKLAMAAPLCAPTCSLLKQGPRPRCQRSPVAQPVALGVGVQRLTLALLGLLRLLGLLGVGLGLALAGDVVSGQQSMGH